MPDKTWLDVADTAVKVGLGTMIGGGFSYLIAYLHHNKEAKKEFISRRMDSIESSFEQINDFSNSISVFWANLANAEFKNREGTLTASEEEELKSLEKQVLNSFTKVNNAKT